MEEMSGLATAINSSNIGFQVLFTMILFYCLINPFLLVFVDVNIIWDAVFCSY